MIDWSPIYLSFQLAICTTVILLVIGFPIAQYLASSTKKRTSFIEAFISLPLVLPPSVLGFYLLILFSPNNVFGNFLDQVIGIKLLFSFGGLLFGSILYSLPFMIQPLQNGISQIPNSLIEASYTLGKSKWETFYRVVIPNMKGNIVTAIVLSFAHTLGEFGVVLMIGGNIPGRTKVASIAIYDEVEALNYAGANNYALILISISFTALLVVYLINKKLSIPFD